MSTSAAAAPLFKATGLGRVYDDGTEALKSVDLTIEQGSFVAILGASGCGKSTLLRILAGLDNQTSGRLDWTGRPPDAGDTGFVFQEPTLLPWASVRDNVSLPLRLAGRTSTGFGSTARDDATDAVADAIRLVGLDDFAGSRPGQLSGGMRMRVSVARALVTRPRLLLMDEPFAALDEFTRFHLNDDLLAIWKATGCTVVFVTHSVFEAVYLAERIVVLASRPARVAADIPNTLTFPRPPGLRTDAAYAAACRVVSDRLSAALA